MGTTEYALIKRRLLQTPKTWLLTGVAGFIGSHLLEALLKLGQRVIGIDDFSTGKVENLQDVRRCCGPAAWSKFQLINDTVCDLAVCRQACKSVDYVLHHAALASVQRSIQDPIDTHQRNVAGFLNMLVAARDGRASRLIYASSSSTYGDDALSEKLEDTRGTPLSLYAATKYVNELYAEIFGRYYGMETIGLRYFNVFGARQDPDGEYSAVIPRWIVSMLEGTPVCINGTGAITRDFVFVADVVQANLLAATTTRPGSTNQVYNVGTNTSTSLLDLFTTVKDIVLRSGDVQDILSPRFRQARPNDVRYSQANLAKISKLLAYCPAHNLCNGLVKTIPWYRKYWLKRRVVRQPAGTALCIL
jgi:UDP-N-acetylglucosamine/UDP-N-acetylgalactosamine 4-epimerase